MLLRDKLVLLIVASYLIIPGEAFLLPLLFPLSIKITVHSHSKPPPPPESSYHFEAVPVYREVVVKGSAHISTPVKQSYGDGQKYGTSYGDGQLKVYTEEPHIKGHKYATGYGSSSGGAIDSHFYVSSHPATSSGHYKGNSGSHYKGEPYPQTTYYKGNSGASYDHGAGYGEIPPTVYKGATYDDKVPPTHYKGTPHGDKAPPTHYKGTLYDENTHYKGTPYEEDAPTHYKGTPYDDDPGHYKGSAKPNILYNNHAYIKEVGGGYKYTDYVSHEKASKYPEDDGGAYITVPPGKSYAEIEAAHKAAHSPKAYSAEQYSDLGASYKKKEYEHDASYLDDSLPAYKSSIPRPHLRSKYKYEASDSSYERVLPEPKKDSTVYAGFGTSVYGDSYAKLAYVPKSLRISISAYARN